MHERAMGNEASFPIHCYLNTLIVVFILVFVIPIVNWIICIIVVFISYHFSYRGIIINDRVFVSYIIMINMKMTFEMNVAMSG